MWDSDSIMRSEPAYSVTDKKLRDDFVQEYLRDYNSYGACVRIGFMDELALETAKSYMEEPYVRRKIADAEDKRSTFLQSDADNDLEKLPEDFKPHNLELDKQRIVSGLFREGFFKGPGSSHAARVSALGKLSEIYGLAKEVKVEEKPLPSVMIVPAMGSIDDWEKGAEKHQTELKQAVRE